MKRLQKLLALVVAVSFVLVLVPIVGAEEGKKININTADLAALESLPGIGPALAQRILDHRQTNGPFASPEGIMEVSGIGPATFEGIQDLITTK